VLSRLDYGSTLLAGLQQQQIDKLQSVQNAAARLLLTDRRRHHITPPLHRLYWLRVAQRIAFPLAMHTYRCLHGRDGTGSRVTGSAILAGSGRVTGQCVKPGV